MRRRRLLTGLGGLAGVGGLVGSGAFTSVSADRSVQVDVANDADAFLALSPCGGPNGDYVTTSGGTVALDVTGSNGQLDGDGVNADGLTLVDDALRIENRGTQPVGVWLDVDSKQYNGTDRVQFYFDGDPSTDVVGRSNAYCLGVGESLCVGFSVDTTGLGQGDPVLNSDTLVVNAEAGIGCSPNLSGVNTGPLAYYPFDGDAVDATGNGFDGSISGAAFTSTAQVGAEALSFDGTDDYVEVADDPALDLTQSLSLVAWVRPSPAIDDYARVVSREQSGVGNRQYNLGIDASATYPRTVVDTTGMNTVEVIGTTGVVDGSWHHLATTFDVADGLRLYVDGVEEDSTGVAAPLVSRAADVLIGAPAHLPNKDYFTGEIDDVRIYDRALSAAEIQDLYDATR